jgi:hypothetical protein
MKALRIAGQTIEGATWLLLHLLAHVLLVVGCVVTLLDKGIEAALTFIRTVQEGLLLRMQEKK